MLSSVYVPRAIQCIFYASKNNLLYIHLFWWIDFTHFGIVFVHNGILGRIACLLSKWSDKKLLLMETMDPSQLHSAHACSLKISSYGRWSLRHHSRFHTGMEPWWDVWKTERSSVCWCTCYWKAVDSRMFLLFFHKARWPLRCAAVVKQSSVNTAAFLVWCYLHNAHVLLEITSLSQVKQSVLLWKYTQELFHMHGNQTYYFFYIPNQTRAMKVMQTVTVSLMFYFWY